MKKWIKNQITNKRNYTLFGGIAGILTLALNAFSGFGLGVALTSLIVASFAALAPLGYSLWKNWETHEDVSRLDAENEKISEEIISYKAATSSSESTLEIGYESSEKYERKLNNLNLVKISKIYRNVDVLAMTLATLLNFFSLGLAFAAKWVEQESTSEETVLGLNTTAVFIAIFSIALYLFSHNLCAAKIRGSYLQLKAEKIGHEAYHQKQMQENEHILRQDVAALNQNLILSAEKIKKLSYFPQFFLPVLSKPAEESDNNDSTSSSSSSLSTEKKFFNLEINKDDMQKLINLLKELNIANNIPDGSSLTLDGSSLEFG